MNRVPHWLRDRPIAHRGLHDARRGVRENSIPAFEAAAQRHFPAELDVRLLADSEVVVFHDRDLHRLTDARGPIASLTSSEARALTFRGSKERVPLLRDVLDRVAGATPLLIEIKNEGDVGRIEPAVLAALEGYSGDYAIQSFHPGTVEWWRQNAPKVPRGLLSGDFRSEPIDEAERRKRRNLDYVDACEPDFIGYDVRLLPFPPLETLRRAGRFVLGWTVRSPDEERRARAHCDNVIFEGYDPR